jgi:hypothetical protein
MKKSLLLVFCAVILLCANSAKAQTLSQSSTTTTLNSSGLISPMGAGSEWGVTIVVTDIHAVPIQGALVSAPCTSLPSAYTDAHGQVSFVGTGACPCTKASVHVTTTGCDKYATIATCGTTTVTCP